MMAAIHSGLLFLKRRSFWSKTSHGLFLASCFLLLANPSTVAAADQCTAIFASGEVNNTQAKLASELERLSRVLKETDLNPVGNDRLIGAYTKSLSGALAKVKTADDLLRLFSELAEFNSPDRALKSALFTMDLLAPLRGKTMAWSETDTHALKILLDKDAESSKNLAGDSIKSALDIILSPAAARTTLENLLNFKGALAYQFLSKADLQRSLLVSLTELPGPVRDELLQMIISKRQERTREFRAKKFTDHQAEIEAKHDLRNTQYLQSLLLHREFTATLSQLDRLYKSSGVNQEFLNTLENYLNLLRLDPNPYSMSTVLQAAQTIRSHMGKVFEARDSIELFGSFPNLNARLGSSDVDMILSGDIGRVGKYNILKPHGTASGLTPPEFNSLSNRARPLAENLIEIENKLQKELHLQEKQGELLGLSFITDFAKTPSSEEALKDRRLRGFAIYGPVTIRISKDSVRLRIHDSLSPAPDMPSSIHEFEIK